MPLVAFVLLAVVCLVLIGFACACLVDQVAQAADRALQAQPAVVDLWHPFALVALALLPGIALSVRASSRASPASLQRFLF
jgi:hypothetical protein